MKKEKLNFLFISSDRYPPFRVDVVELFGKELVARGHRIDWILQSEGDCDQAYATEALGGKVLVGAANNGTARWQRIAKHWASLTNDFKLFSLIKSNGYHFVQVKDKFLTAIMVILAAKWHHIKFFYWLSWPFPEESLLRAKDGTARYPLFYWLRGHFFRWLLYRVIMKYADHVFVQSEQMKRDVIAMGIPSEKLTAVPMGVALRKIPPLETASSPGSGRDSVVLYLGTLSRVRKLDFLLRVFARVLQKIPQAKLHLVGGGEDQEDERMLKAEATRLGIDKALLFTGFLPMEKAWEYVKNADVCVSPFYPIPILNSTSPTKLVEYMAFGKAVVANDHPEQKLVIEASGAGICTAYEEAAFAEGIMRLLSDPATAFEMGKRGRLYVERERSYEQLAHMVEKQYFKLCFPDS